LSSQLFGKRHELLNRKSKSFNMRDLHSVARASSRQAPVALLARSLLAADHSITAVMVVGKEGRVMAHERAIGYEEGDAGTESGRPVLFYAPERGLVFFVRLSGTEPDARVCDRLVAMIESKNLSITR
jgi:hypothetical protein